MIGLGLGHIFPLNRLGNGRENIERRGGGHVDHLVAGVGLVVGAVYKVVVALLPEHHGLADAVLFLGVLFVVLGDGGAEALPEGMGRRGVFFPGLGNDAAVAVAAALGLHHEIVHGGTLPAALGGGIGLPLEGHGGGTAQLRAADIPVADVQLLLCPVGAEVLAAAAHQKGVVTLVADERAGKLAAHEGMDAEAVVVAVELAGGVEPGVGFLAHHLGALGIVRHHNAKRLGGGGAEHGLKAAGVVERLLIGIELVPWRLHGVEGGKSSAFAAVFGNSFIDFLTHDYASSSRVSGYCSMAAWYLTMLWDIPASATTISPVMPSDMGVLMA